MAVYINVTRQVEIAGPEKLVEEQVVNSLEDGVHEFKKGLTIKVTTTYSDTDKRGQVRTNLNRAWCDDKEHSEPKANTKLEWVDASKELPSKTDMDRKLLRISFPGARGQKHRFKVLIGSYRPFVSATSQPDIHWHVEGIGRVELSDVTHWMDLPKL